MHGLDGDTFARMSYFVEVAPRIIDRMNLKRLQEKVEHHYLNDVTFDFM